MNGLGKVSDGLTKVLDDLAKVSVGFVSNWMVSGRCGMVL